MKRIARGWKNLIDQKPPNRFKLFFLFIMDAVRTITPARIVVALGAALSSAASALAFILSNEPFTTNPVELLGCFAYYSDLNITNRLAGITLFMLVSLLTFLIFAAFFFAMRGRENEALLTIGYCLLPVSFWLTSIILKPQSAFDTFWLYLSAGLCWFALISFLRERRNKNSTGSTTFMLIAFSLSFFIAPAMLVFIKSPLFWKLPFFTQPQHAQEIILLLGGWLDKLHFLPPLFVLLIWMIFPRQTVLLRFALFPVQICLLLFFCLILPSSFLVDDVLTRFFNSTPAFYIIVLPLLVVGIWDCSRRCIFNVRSPLSPFSFLALLIFFFLDGGPIPGFNSNLYEFGSRFPEFWVSFNGWASLFKDVYITFGLWDYAQFLFAWLFSGQHTAAVSTYGTFLFQAFILILEFFAVNSFLPVGLAFLICLIAGVGPQSVVLIFLSILLRPRLIDRPAVWIALWIVLSAIAPFAKIPQGTVCVIASLPAFLWQAVNLFRQNRKMFWKMACFVGIAGFVMVVWPFGGYFWGLLRIISETAKVNSPWAANVWKIDSTPLFEVVLGNAVLVMPLVSLVVAFTILRRGYRQSKFFVAFFLCSFVMLYVFTSTGYGFSRTDSTPYRRQLQVLLTILLPLLAGIMAYVPSRSVRAGCIGVLLCFTSLWPRYISSPMNFLQTASDFPTLVGSEIQDAGDFGLPHLGVGRFPGNNLLQEESTLKQALDRVLATDETFLDLTMVGLHYFSSQRQLITEYPVYYVYPGDNPQLRAIEELRSHNVRVTLLQPNYFDESPSPLRTYYLYRYALLHGFPWEITPTKTLLLPPGYFDKLGLTPPDPTQTLRLLDKQFPMTNFSYLPGVWGRGYKEFAADLRLVRELTTTPCQVDNCKASIELSLQPPLRGVDAGLLVLDVDMSAHFESDIILQWVDEALPTEVNQIQFKPLKGTNIVPLDASPRWLLARSITALTIKTPFSFPTSQMERNNFWQLKTSLPAVPLKLQQQDNYSFIADGKLLAQNHNPNIFYSIPDSLAGQNLLLHIVLMAPQGANSAQIFYRTASTNYNETDSERIPLSEGRNDLYFTIPEEMSIEELRFDPGEIAGNYVVSTIEAKSALITSPIEISRVALFQRPHIDDN